MELNGHKAFFVTEQNYIVSEGIHSLEKKL